MAHIQIWKRIAKYSMIPIEATSVGMISVSFLKQYLTMMIAQKMKKLRIAKIGPISGNSVLLMHSVCALLGLYPAWVHSRTQRPVPSTSSSRKGCSHSRQLPSP